jgi:hypothetical protein
VSTNTKSQGCKDELGFGLNYQRMDRIEPEEPMYNYLLKNGRIQFENERVDAEETDHTNEEDVNKDNNTNKKKKNGDGDDKSVTSKTTSNSLSSSRAAGSDGVNSSGGDVHSGESSSSSSSSGGGGGEITAAAEEEKQKFGKSKKYNIRFSLKGHQWWGYADETLGWTLAHMACRKDKVVGTIGSFTALSCVYVDIHPFCL